MGTHYRRLAEALLISTDVFTGKEQISIFVLLNKKLFFFFFFFCVIKVTACHFFFFFFIIACNIVR